MSLESLLQEAEEFIEKSDNYSKKAENQVLEDVEAFFSDEDLENFYVLDEGINSPEKHDEGTLDIVVVTEKEYLSLTHTGSNCRSGYYKLDDFSVIELNENDQRLELQIRLNVGAGAHISMAGYEEPQKSKVREIAQVLRKNR